jgi:hypothetical protein
MGIHPLKKILYTKTNFYLNSYQQILLKKQTPHSFLFNLMQLALPTLGNSPFSHVETDSVTNSFISKSSGGIHPLGSLSSDNLLIFLNSSVSTHKNLDIFSSIYILPSLLNNLFFSVNDVNFTRFSDNSHFIKPLKLFSLSSFVSHSSPPPQRGEGEARANKVSSSSKRVLFGAANPLLLNRGFALRAPSFSLPLSLSCNKIVSPTYLPSLLNILSTRKREQPTYFKDSLFLPLPKLPAHDLTYFYLNKFHSNFYPLDINIKYFYSKTHSAYTFLEHLSRFLIAFIKKNKGGKNKFQQLKNITYKILQSLAGNTNSLNLVKFNNFSANSQGFASKAILGLGFRYSGRVYGATKAMSFKMLLGSVPFNTLKANIDYAQIMQKTRNGT